MFKDQTTIAEFVRQAGLSLQALPDLSQVADARREARQILSQALGWDLACQYAEPNRQLDSETWAWLWEIVDRRLAHEPLSAILGHRDFYGRSFQLPPGGLAPRPETELLVQLGLDLAPSPQIPNGPSSCLQLAELCCGSGAPGLSLLAELRQREQRAELLLLDLDPLAVATAKANADNLGLAEACRFQVADLFPPKSAEGPERFDLILVNPPYIPSAEISQLMPEVRDHEHARALDGGIDGLDFYRRLAAEIGTWLKPGAWLIMEHGAGQRADIQKLFVKGPEHDQIVDCRTLDDYAGLDRVLALQYKAL